MELWGIPPCFYKLPLSSFCPCSLWVGQGAEGPPAWAHGPGMLAFSGLLFPAPYVHGLVQPPSWGPLFVFAAAAKAWSITFCLGQSTHSALELQAWRWRWWESPLNVCVGAQGGFSFHAGCVGGEMLGGVKSQINFSGRWLSISRDSFPGSGVGISLSCFLCSLGWLAALRVCSQDKKTLPPELPCRVDLGSREGIQPSCGLAEM